jgi:hypothetical protein
VDTSAILSSLFKSVEIPIAYISDAINIKQYLTPFGCDFFGKCVKFILRPGEQNDFILSAKLFCERETESRANAGNDCESYRLATTTSSDYV